MTATNLSIQPGNMDRGSLTDFNRPSMKQDTHPEHNMPSSEHDGTELKTMFAPMMRNEDYQKMDKTGQ